MDLMTTAKTIAEVLAEHQWYDATTDNEDPATGCTGCDDWFGSEDALDDGTFAAHQTAVLSAAGFGLVTDAKAEAALEAAQDIVTGLAESCPDATLAIGFVEGYRDACEDAIREPVVSRSVRDPDYRQEKPAPNPYEDEEGQALVQAIHDRKNQHE